MRIELENGKYATGIDEHNQLFFEYNNETWHLMDNFKTNAFLRLLIEEIDRLQKLEYEIQFVLLKNKRPE